MRKRYLLLSEHEMLSQENERLRREHRAERHVRLVVSFCVMITPAERSLPLRQNGRKVAFNLSFVPSSNAKVND